MMKKVIWYNTFKENMQEYFSRTLKGNEVDMFYMLWYSFRLNYLVKSSFFESIRLGDEKYTLWVHKASDGVIIVKFIIL